MKYSLTFTGVLISVVGTFLTDFGFSEVCSNEIVGILPVIIGGAVALVGRVRAGGVNLLGFKG